MKLEPKIKLSNIYLLNIDRSRQRKSHVIETLNMKHYIKIFI